MSGEQNGSCAVSPLGSYIGPLSLHRLAGPEIQLLASASVAKSPTRESGPTPVFTTTNQRPSFALLGSKRGNPWLRAAIGGSSVISSDPVLFASASEWPLDG